MDAIKIVEVIEKLMKLLQKMSVSGEEFSSDIVERIEFEVNAIKEEFGSWIIDDFELYQAS